eukprot:852412-Rhodomonas_salina.1
MRSNVPYSCLVPQTRSVSTNTHAPSVPTHMLRQYQRDSSSTPTSQSASLGTQHVGPLESDAKGAQHFGRLVPVDVSESQHIGLWH